MSTEQTSKSPVWFLRLFGFMFFLVGAGISYPMLVKPVMGVISAREWTEVPCKIIFSEVASHRGSKGGSTYSVEIRYTYQIGSQTYEGDRYDFAVGSSSGYESKRAVVAEYPPGKEARCFVNPTRPSEAVINRDWSSGMYFGLLPLLFVVVGTFIMAFSGKMARTKSRPVVPTREDVLPASTGCPNGETFPGNSVELKSTASPGWKLFGVTFGALFWCGITGVFVAQAVIAFRAGRPEWFLTIFMVPFVLVGLGLICAVFYQLLAFFNPRLHVTVNSRSVPLGGSLDLQWHLRGNAGRVSRMHFSLEAREEARYRRGTSTSTDTNVFFKLPFGECSDAMMMSSGVAGVTVPEHLIHTFSASNNKIIWSLRARGEIARWPDISEEFEIVVLPKP